jgi:hypothetical protein
MPSKALSKREPCLLTDIIKKIQKQDAPKKWTQDALAEELGTTHSTISKMQTTNPKDDWYKHWPILWRLQLLCDQLEIKTEK